MSASDVSIKPKRRVAERFANRVDRVCTLCGDWFLALNKYCRFCATCKSSDAYRNPYLEYSVELTHTAKKHSSS